MWQCGLCRTRLCKSSGIQRLIRTPSGHCRVAGICPACAACQVNQENTRSLWKTLAVFSTVALSAGMLSFFLMMPK